MIRAVILGFLFILAQVGIAQDASLVPLYLSDYENATTDSARCHNLWQAAYNLAHKDPKLGIEYGRKALALGLKINHHKLIGDCHNSLGYCFDSSGNADSAMTHYGMSIQQLELAGAQCETAGVFANMGSSFQRRNEVSKALESFLKAMDIQQNCEDIGYHGSTLYAIGTCYNKLEKWDLALDYFHRSLEKELARGNKAKEAIVHNGMANAYAGKKDYVSARKEFARSVELYILTENHYSMAYAFEGMAELFHSQNQLDSSIYYCSKALNIFKEMDIGFDIVYESTLLATYLKEKKDYDGAEKILLETLPVSIKESLPYDQQTILSELSGIFFLKGDYKKAYEFLDESTQLRDSLKLDEQKAQLAEVAGRYETEKRDKIIAVEQAENAKQRQQKYFFLGGAILFLLLALVLINRYRVKQRSERLLNEKNIQVEKARERAELSEKSKQLFLANMSHEIRTPMNAITGLSRLLLDTPHDIKTTEYLHAIQHSSENLLTILNDILDLSKIEAGKLDIESIPFRVRNEVLHLKTIFSERVASKNISFAMEVADDVPDIIVGDPTRLGQVLNNLVSNAIKFTEKGKVHLSVKNIEPGTLHFTVVDTGIGIPEEKIHLIFESFSQANTGDARRFGGTGLGLTIARYLVQLMGGEISVSSQPGKGSTFGFTMKYRDATAEEVQELSLGTVHSTVQNDEKISVLVAEDNEYNFMVTRDTILKYYPSSSVHRAVDGSEAVSMVGSGSFSLVLMDVQMPLMDGYEATRQIRASQSDVPIYGLTASVIRSDLDRCVEAGMDGYLAKPFREKDLLRIIQQATNTSGVVTHTPLAGDSEKIKQRFLKFMPARIELLNSALHEKDHEGIQRLVHMIRPQLVRSGLAHLDPICIEIETSDPPFSTIEPKVQVILDSIRKHLDKLRNEAP